MKLREMTVDDRVSWGFSLAVALAGIAVAWWINLVASEVNVEGIGASIGL